MKTFQTRDVPYEVNHNPKIKALITLNACPFCGDLVQRPPNSAFAYIQDVEHNSWNCADWVDNAVTWFMGEEHMSIGFFVDPDGDWWIFDPEHEYEDINHYLRPIERKKLNLMLDSALAEYTKTLDRIHRAKDILMNTETA